MNAHLLIVDDDERIRSLLKQFLLRNGFLVSAARDAMHARKILSGLDFDMIILDIMMPGEDGVSLTKHIRETRQTPILLLTAKGETEDRIVGLKREQMIIWLNRLSLKNCCCALTQFCAASPNQKLRKSHQRSYILGFVGMTFLVANCGREINWCD